MRPKTKNTNNIFHAQTTKNTKNKTTKKKKQTTIIIAVFYRIRVHYTVLTQHTTPTNNTQPHAAQVTRPQPARSCLHQGVIYRTTTVLPQTPNSMP